MGTALAKLISETGHPVALWVYEPELVDQINRGRENTMFLPGCELPENLLATNSFAEALDGADLVLSVTPSQVLRNVSLSTLSSRLSLVSLRPRGRAPLSPETLSR